MSFKARLVRVHWLLSAQLGFDPRVMFRALQGLPRYVMDYFKFRADYAGAMELVPCLHDWHAEAGATRNEYFLQDLFVARMIFANKPKRHVDIGSRIDGFVAHVASFREIEVFDVRPVTSQIPGVTFRQADLMRLPENFTECCDSLSCLHALEHFGLGRYGDPLEPLGFERGVASMASLLAEGGVFYLSVPVGTKRVEFNAQRISDPREIVDMARQHRLALDNLMVIEPAGQVTAMASSEQQLARVAAERYSLGIFTFRKTPRIRISE